MYSISPAPSGRGSRRVDWAHCHAGVAQGPSLRAAPASSSWTRRQYYYKLRLHYMYTKSGYSTTCTVYKALADCKARKRAPVGGAAGGRRDRGANKCGCKRSSSERRKDAKTPTSFGEGRMWYSHSYSPQQIGASREQLLQDGGWSRLLELEKDG